MDRKISLASNQFQFNPRTVEFQKEIIATEILKRYLP